MAILGGASCAEAREQPQQPPEHRGRAAPAQCGKHKCKGAERRAQGAAQKARVTNVVEFRKLVVEGGALNTMEMVGDTAILATGHSRRTSSAAGAGAVPIGGLETQAAQGSVQGGTRYRWGGMRGCVAAGMASALIDAGLGDCFDEIYGSSAGALVVAYRLPNSFGMVQYGCSIYYDLLTDKNSKNFIDKMRALTLLGYGFARYFTPRFFQEVFGSRQKDLPLYACVHVFV